MVHYVLFFKQKTAYDLRISDWSSDVCSSDLNAQDHDRDHRDPVAFVPKAHILHQSVPFTHYCWRGLPPREWRSAVRRAGNVCVSTGRSRWSPFHSKTKKIYDKHPDGNNDDHTK